MMQHFSYIRLKLIENLFRVPQISAIFIPAMIKNLYLLIKKGIGADRIRMPLGPDGDRFAIGEIFIALASP
jgi:hypothetical protein